ncbi:MAG: hypothetical protein A3E87_10685 [Gammaproteobacteria bacterium RIFCSPHIGHO2_12_FULL_35_23]|nr:MAG: hypothetical protein A3E87_10685 [Gammaproteobacteria bacterium RIFCSPHIGHO2_12_FULL_35_23]
MQCKLLLEKNRNFSPTYSKNLSNHLSMALIALERMGANLSRLNGYFEASVIKYRLNIFSISTNKIELSNWQNYLGDRKEFFTYCSFFNKELGRIGVNNLLKIYIPMLMPGVGAQAFHCIIRLAYAIDAKDNQEIVFSLAYWASTYWPIQIKSDNHSISVSIEDYLSHLSKLRDLEVVVPQGNIEDRMKSLCQQASFLEVLSNFRLLEEVNLSNISELSIRLYLVTKNFTILHAVTSCHAMRLILPFLENSNQAFIYYWNALCVAYLIEKAPTLSLPKKLEMLLIWDEIKKRRL